MELKTENYTQLNINFKNELYFNKTFTNKIKELKVFIYGLRGVNKYK